MKQVILAYIVSTLLVLAISTVILFAFNVVPWLLWNHFLAPMFHWPQCGFWKMLLFIWCINFVKTIIFPSK